MRALTLFFCMAAGAAMAQAPTPGSSAPPAISTAPMPMEKPVPHAAMIPGMFSTQAYTDAMNRMMADMGKPYTGDADRDFVTHMIPHHQGAIDMAEIELKYGSDPRLKKLAAHIISAQQNEILMMQDWLKRHPAPPPQPTGRLLYK